VLQINVLGWCAGAQPLMDDEVWAEVRNLRVVVTR
jgi:hypothetical protein